MSLRCEVGETGLVISGFCLALILMLGIPASASAGADTWQANISVGGEVRFERNQDQDIVPRVMPNLGVGFVIDRWSTMLEYAQFSESTSVGFFQLDRQAQTVMAWASCQLLESMDFQPYASAGYGGYRQIVETKMAGQTDHDESTWSSTWGLGAGLKIPFGEHFWISAEGRVYKNTNFDPDPMLGMLARAGLAF